MRRSSLAQSHLRVLLTTFLLCLVPALGLAGNSPASIIFNEDFESGWGWWYADNGVWGVGAPTAGPAEAFEGTACAGTSLDGSYPQSADSRLISPPVVLPGSPDGDGLWLSLENWFSLGAGDAVTIEISDDGTMSWTDLGPVFQNASECWTHFRTAVDITAYAGSTVQFALHVVDDGGSAANPAGFYLDLFTVYDGAPPNLTLPGDFESGNDGWFADNGSWQIGQPTVGPVGGHASSNCAGTKLDGPYARYADSRLVSPFVELGTPGGGNALFLTFQHWGSISNGDSAVVEITTDGSTWTSVTGILANTNEQWQPVYVDISAYAGQTVAFGFAIRDDSGSGTNNDGWFVDDVDVFEGPPRTWPPVEGFENGFAGWYVEGGVWEIGAPTAGPGQPHDGTNCAGTNLGGNYPRYADARLISPLTTLPSNPEDGVLQLSFWQWYLMYDHADECYVEIRTDGGDWIALYNRQPIYGTSWTRMLVDISAYAGQTVQIAFHLDDNSSGGESHGWFIDDVDIIAGQPASWTHEDFENGLGGWYAESGTWNVGSPTVGTDAFAGSSCAATRLDANYERYADSRLISPPTTLSANPNDGSLQLSFWQWYLMYDHADECYVEIRTDGGDWIALYNRQPIYGTSWTRMLVDISAYAGQTVQFAFRIADNWSGGESHGWFIDEVEIVEGLPASWTHEDFENGLGGWYAESGTWNAGVPDQGFDAQEGSSCAATRLDANYERFADSRLISPPTLLPSNPAEGLLTIRFQQWYELYDHGDHLYFEIRSIDGDWIQLYTTVGIYARDWVPHSVDIRSFAGQTVQFAFRIADNWSGGEARGWFIDSVEILEGWQADPIPQTFEQGWGDWSADGGAWQVGEPDAGPDRAHSGAFCAGTNLSANYPRYCDSRLSSPPITLDFPSDDGTYWLSFWHWFYLYNQGDHIYIEVKGESGNWDTLREIASPYSPSWTRCLLDLSAYAGQEVQLGFRIYDNWDGGESHGWFIDDIDIIGGASPFTSPDNFENAAWAQLPDLGGWSADNGSWEFGKPQFGNGPATALEGDFCAGTSMTGNYIFLADSRLVSPPIELDPTPLEGQLWFTFQHWYNLYTNDTGTLEILLPDSTWTPITEPFVRSGGDWTMHTVDVSAYAGQTVQFGFHLLDNPSHSSHVAAGWYIDKVSLVSGPKLFNSPEGFETRTKGWSAEAGAWQIGAPTVGPDAPHTGNWCAGTVLDGNYPRYIDSRFISPTMTVPAGAMARFYQWYALAAGDSALFEISVDGADWVQLGGFTTTAEWAPYISNLAAYVGQDVRFAFRLKDNNDGAQDFGWYVDSFEILNLPVDTPDTPVFHDVTYSADVPVLSWDITAVDHEYMAVYAGHFDAYEPDFGNRIALTTDNPFQDVDHAGWRSGYFISSVNAIWQESEVTVPGEVIGVDETLPSYPTALSQNYPNPFNPTTVVSFTLASAADVNIEIFDVAGRKVDTLLQERLEAGRYEIPFDGRQHASGVYFCRFQTKGYSETRKMMLVK